MRVRQALGRALRFWSSSLNSHWERRGSGACRRGSHSRDPKAVPPRRIAKRSVPSNEWWRDERDDAAIDRDVERTCTSKDAYETPEAARAVAAMNGMADVLFTYQCRYCQSWHLTRRPTSQ